jgi:hypothetical protein
VQLVYGRQLQQKADERPTADIELEPAQRDALIRELAAAEPELARQLGIEN